jgi:hypothetical protein
VAAREPEAAWRKSSECGNGECVEVAVSNDSVLIRNSQQPDKVVTFTAVEWTVFARGMRLGEFDDLG